MSLTEEEHKDLQGFLGEVREHQQDEARILYAMEKHPVGARICTLSLIKVLGSDSIANQMPLGPGECIAMPAAKGKDIFFEVHRSRHGDPVLYMHGGGHIEISITFQNDDEIKDVLNSLAHALETEFDPMGLLREEDDA